jgi:hypothetical protein
MKMFRIKPLFYEDGRINPSVFLVHTQTTIFLIGVGVFISGSITCAAAIHFNLQIALSISTIALWSIPATLIIEFLLLALSMFIERDAVSFGRFIEH